MRIDTQHLRDCTGDDGGGTHACCKHPQTVAAYSDATIVVFGGAAGGGKTFWLCYEGAKYVDTPGYQGSFFRRTYDELKGSGSLWDETEQLYPMLGGTCTLSPLEWRFTTPRVLLQAQHMQYGKSAEKHKSKQYAFIGIDELCDWEEKPFWKLVSRLRSMSGVQPRLRASCNPDPDSFVRRLIDWWIGADGYPVPERSGVKRFFVRPKRDLLWADTAEELLPYVPEKDHEGKEIPHEQRLKRVMSLTFVSSLVTDNKILLDRDPEYLAKLDALPPVERARFRGGNWDTRENAGDYFQRGWFPDLANTELERLVKKQPKSSDFIYSIRHWDLGATAVVGCLVPGVQRPDDFIAHPETDDPDWSVGTKVDMTRDKKWMQVTNVVRYRDVPGAMEEAIVKHAIEDGPRTVIGLEVEPGALAKYGMENLQKKLRQKVRGCRIYVFTRTKDKETYARTASRAVYHGRVFVSPQHRWYKPWMLSLESFPPPDDKGHDDDTDSLSGAILYLDQLSPSSGVGIESVHTVPSVIRKQATNTRTRLNTV